jgi:hypothetical protein
VKRLAFFVEGLTESFFVEKLLTEIFGQKQIAIEINKMQGGASAPITIIQNKPAAVTEETKYYILIYDCGGDGNIRSYIDDQRNSLITAGYEKIIGIRDVHPVLRADIHKLQYGLNFKTPQKPIPTIYILSIMEIEAWFLSEYTHFDKIDVNLTTTLINTFLGFDPEKDNMELRNQPANDLNDCYKLVGKAYTKRGTNIQRTIGALDYALIYFDIKNRVPALNEIINEINYLFK